MRVEGDSNLEWNFSWRRRLFVWEEELYNNLLSDIEGVVLSEGEDDWWWNLEEDGVFTVNSFYGKLESFSVVEEEMGEDDRRMFTQLWKSPAPSKMVALSWKALLNRIPTRVNLFRRNAIPPNGNLQCVFCNMEEESNNHLFVHCHETWKIWFLIQQWLDVCIITPPNLAIHWMCWNGVTPYRKELIKGMRLIWHATVWGIRIARNNVIFKDETFRLDDIVELIKVLSWRWSLARLKMSPCLLYEWKWDPKSCLCRRQ
jgi:hypothetical protein